jgi:hypothetical protein
MSGTCGNGQIGNSICSNVDECCSTYGYCGTTVEHCSTKADDDDNISSFGGKDKIFHFLGIAIITCCIFTVLFLGLERCYYRRKWWEDLPSTSSPHSNNTTEEEKNDLESNSLPSFRSNDGLGQNSCLRFPVRKRGYYLKLAIMSGTIAFLVGVIKELFDKYEIWWKGGDPSWGDIVADGIGVLVGLLLIFIALHVRQCLLWIIGAVSAVQTTASGERELAMRGDDAHAN